MIDLPSFTLDDEAYGDLAMRDGVEPLMHVRAAAGDWQPALWTREHGNAHEAAVAYHEALGLWTSRNDHWYIMLALVGLTELASAYRQAPAAPVS